MLIIRTFTYEKYRNQIVSQKYRIIPCYADCALSLTLDFSFVEKYGKGYNKEDAEGRGGAKRAAPALLFPATPEQPPARRRHRGQGHPLQAAKMYIFAMLAKTTPGGLENNAPISGDEEWLFEEASKERNNDGHRRPARLNKRRIWAKSRLAARKAL